MEDSVDQHVARWATYWKNEPAFNPQVEGALVRMKHLLRWIERADAAAFAVVRDEFTLQDYQTLHALMVLPWPNEATPAQLAEATGVSRPAMTSRLERLAELALITREMDATDRRRILVRPSKTGRAMWSKYIFEGIARDGELMSALTDEELGTLNALLRKVLVALEK